ncbi:MAG: type II toxin-antitoxin system RelE family toxin [Candidatus Kariarchaeaceae archaeon]|jgi:mRNA-degrading endonuclease RelE of RelBE toxin-antitoxin system
MAVDIIFPESVAKQLKKLNRNTAQHIVKSIYKISSNPKEEIYPIANSNYYKMRVGDYQIIFDIQEANLRILKIIPPS